MFRYLRNWWDAKSPYDQFSFVLIGATLICIAYFAIMATLGPHLSQ